MSNHTHLDTVTERVGLLFSVALLVVAPLATAVMLIQSL
jgi:hypothetical protein